jgi:hypothetical protein
MLIKTVFYHHLNLALCQLSWRRFIAIVGTGAGRKAEFVATAFAFPEGLCIARAFKLDVNGSYETQCQRGHGISALLGFGSDRVEVPSFYHGRSDNIEYLSHLHLIQKTHYFADLRQARQNHDRAAFVDRHLDKTCIRYEGRVCCALDGCAGGTGGNSGPQVNQEP